MENDTNPSAAQGTLRADVVPLWPSRGFWGFCRSEIRKGLLVRYWITLSAMWRREQQFRRELTDCLNEPNAEGHGRAVARTVQPLVGDSE